VTAYAFAAIGFGAALGAWLRWLLSLLLNPVLGALPLGTLAANCIGGYLIGVSVEYLGRHMELPHEVRLFVITGFLGGLTTFSTFSAEAVLLLQRQQYGWMMLLIGAHVIGSIVLTGLGIATVRALSA
jgi:fluoride exporter